MLGVVKGPRPVHCVHSGQRAGATDLLLAVPTGLNVCFIASLRLVVLCVQVRLYLVVCVNRYTENKTCSGLSGPLDGYPLEAIPRGSGVDAVMTIGWLIVAA